jgi:hypothetical protein
MGQADAQFIYTEGSSTAGGFRVQAKVRFAVFVVYNFYLLPANALTPQPATQYFSGSFFGGKAGGQLREAAPAILPFKRSIDALQKTLSQTGDGLFYPRYFNQVYPTFQHLAFYPVIPTGSQP